MTEGLTAELRRQVVERARGRCEYCGLSQEGQEATFHVDHVVPRSAGGGPELSNLALACVSCSLHKAARMTAVDAQTGEETRLFHPRRDRWKDHFRWEGVVVTGLTAVGRTTVRALRLNRPLIVAIRTEEEWLGRHPPE